MSSKKKKDLIGLFIIKPRQPDGLEKKQQWEPWLKPQWFKTVTWCSSDHYCEISTCEEHVTERFGRASSVQPTMSHTPPGVMNKERSQWNSRVGPRLAATRFGLWCTRGPWTQPSGWACLRQPRPGARVSARRPRFPRCACTWFL